MKRKTLIVASILLGSLLAYQNCSMVASTHNEVSSFGKTCATIVQKTYRDSYYPHLREQCSACHADGGRGRIYFASYNFNTAAENFMNTGRQKIEAMMLTEGHQGNPYNGPSQQTFINRYARTWAAAEAEAEACGTNSAVQTTYKNTPTGNQINPDSGDQNTEKWTTLEWDLLSETLRPELAGKISLVVSIQYRKLILGGVLEGYEFRRPMGRMGTGSASGLAYTLDGMTIYVNDHQLANATAYESLLVTVSSTTASPLIIGANAPGPVPHDPNTGQAIMDFANDKIALRFKEIRDPNGHPTSIDLGGGSGGGSSGGSLAPARVTYQDLMDPTTPAGVFVKYCVTCHNSTTAQGSLNLQSYASAAAVADSIKSRTHSATRPMPTSGLLPQYEQDVIARWVDLGAPQN